VTLTINDSNIIYDSSYIKGFPQNISCYYCKYKDCNMKCPIFLKIEMED
jgi:NADPH-dependent glutamate synthase beta subunit-like oxidoreductase